MSELRLVSPSERPLKPLVEAALANEVRLLESGIQRTKKRLQQFEESHQMASEEFVRRFENNELDESLEYIEWIGEYRLLKRLQDKADTLRAIKFAS